MKTRCRKRGQCKEFLLGDMAGLAVGPRQWFSSCSCPGKGSLPARQRPADRGRRHHSGQGAPPRHPAPAGSLDPSSGWASGFRGRPWRREPRGRTQTCRRTSHRQPDNQGDTLSHVCQEYRPLYYLITDERHPRDLMRTLVCGIRVNRLILWMCGNVNNIEMDWRGLNSVSVGFCHNLKPPPPQFDRVWLQAKKTNNSNKKTIKMQNGWHSLLSEYVRK